MNPTPLKRTYYPALDVLRGIAILFVFFYHNFQFLQVFEFGWAGVDLFFVLSGFLITDILLSSSDNKNYFRNFYARRFLRIFPLYYVTLILFFALYPFLFSNEHKAAYQYYSQNQFWFWLHVENWLFVKKGFSTSPYLTHFWSLAIEEQFYLFWPLIIYFLKDLKKIKITIVALIVVALAIRVYMRCYYPANFANYYCNTLTRMDSILIGCLLSIHIKEGKKISGAVLKWLLAGCVAYFAGGFLLGGSLNLKNPYFSTFGYTIVSVFFASLLYIFLHKDFSILRWLKGSFLLNYLGKISYGIYVFHIPVYLVLSSLLMKILQKSYGMNSLQALFFIATVSLIVTLVASSLSFYYFEKPFMRLKKHFE